MSLPLLSADDILFHTAESLPFDLEDMHKQHTNG